MSVLSRYRAFVYVFIGILFVFVLRLMLAARFHWLRTDDLFTMLTLAGSLVVLTLGYRQMKPLDWIIGTGTGLLVGATMYPATLFTPYDFLGIVHGNLAQALARGICTAIAMMGGLVIMRRGGPVQVSLAQGKWKKVVIGIAIGLAAGAPLAILNVFALQLTQGHPIDWQNPLAAISDALQPALFEEIVYRFAFLGLVWLLIRPYSPLSANWLAGILTLLTHNFIHFDDLWLQAPLTALGMGLGMALLWGLPPTILALRRDLESAAAFHWIQDAARFLTGF